MSIGRVNQILLNDCIDNMIFVSVTMPGIPPPLRILDFSVPQDGNFVGVVEHYHIRVQGFCGALSQ